MASPSSAIENNQSSCEQHSRHQVDRTMNEMMIIEVNFGKEKSDSIVVHFNDHADDLAAEFVRKHGLKSTAVPRVAKYIQDTIQEFKEVNSQLRPQTPPCNDAETDIDQRNSNDKGNNYQPADLIDNFGNTMQPPAELSSPNRNDSDDHMITSSMSGGGSNEQPGVLHHPATTSTWTSDVPEEEGSDHGVISSCSETSDHSNVHHRMVAYDNGVDTNDYECESAEEKYNRLRETCSIASSNNSSYSPTDRKYKNNNHKGGKGGSRTRTKPQPPIPLLEKMKRVDFFQSNISSNKNDMVRRGSTRTTNGDNKNMQQGSANERLYKDAFKSKQRKDRIEAKAKADEKKELADMQWEMNEGSKKIMKNYTTSSSSKSVGDVGDRLYQDGLREKEKRLKFSSEEKKEYEEGAFAFQLEVRKEKEKEKKDRSTGLKNDTSVLKGYTDVFDYQQQPPEEEEPLEEEKVDYDKVIIQHVNDWSCARCGTYHVLKHVQIKASVHLNDVQKICSKCNWDQSKQEPFKPFIMTIEQPVKGAVATTKIHEKRDAHIDAITSSLGKTVSLGIDLSSSLSTSIDESSDNNSAFDGISDAVENIKNGNKNVSKIHEYLHADKQIQDIKRVQLVCKHLDEESKVYTFKPSIPHSSHTIVSKYKERPRSHSPPPPPPSSAGVSSSLKTDGKVISRYTDEVNWEASLTSGRIGDRKVNPKSPPRKRHQHQVHQDTTTTNGGKNATNVPLENYFKQPTHTRLFKHDKSRASIVHEKVSSSIPPPPPAENKENEKEPLSLSSSSPAISATACAVIASEMKRDLQLKKQKQKEYTDKLVYEYKIKNQKVEKLTEKLKPTFEPETYGFSAELDRLDDQDLFITDLLRRGKVHEDNKTALKQVLEKREQTKIETSKQKSKPLAHSIHILEQANNRIIDEMFRLLVIDQKERDIASGEYDEIKSLANENDQLDIARMNVDIMNLEIRELLVMARQEYVKSMKREQEEEQHEMYVGFEQFKKLITSSMKKKGIGKSYICAPKKKPEVTVQLLLEAETGLTFKPDLSLIPKQFTDSRINVDKEVMSNHLYSKYKDIQHRKEKLREKLMKDELKGCTFQPKLYKPPDNVQASYRHHGQHSKTKKAISGRSSLDIRDSPHFISATNSSSSSSKPLTHSLLISSPMVTVDRTHIQDTLTPDNDNNDNSDTDFNMSMSQKSTASTSSVNIIESIPLSKENEERDKSGVNSSPEISSGVSPSYYSSPKGNQERSTTPPLSVATALPMKKETSDESTPEQQLQPNEKEAGMEKEVIDESRFRRTSSDVSSLEAAGVRELGEYDETFHQEREQSIQQQQQQQKQHSDQITSSSDLYHDTRLVRSLSEDTSEMLSAMISQEIEQSSLVISSSSPTSPSGGISRTDQNVPCSEEGSAEIDSNPIPFETYSNVTEHTKEESECNYINDDDQMNINGTSSQGKGESHQQPTVSMNPFDFVDVGGNDTGNNEMLALNQSEGETNQETSTAGERGEHSVGLKSDEYNHDDAPNDTHKKHHGGVKHGRGKHSRMHHSEVDHSHD